MLIHLVPKIANQHSVIELIAYLKSVLKPLELKWIFFNFFVFNSPKIDKQLKNWWTYNQRPSISKKLLTKLHFKHVRYEWKSNQCSFDSIDKSNLNLDLFANVLICAVTHYPTFTQLKCEHALRKWNDNNRIQK